MSPSSTNQHLFLIHSRGGANESNFYTYVEDFCNQNNIPFVKPQIVEKEETAEGWLQEIIAFKDMINSNTIFVAHSMGCIAICRYLSDQNIPFHSLHLVAPWYHNCNSNNIKSDLQGLSFDPYSIKWSNIVQNCLHINIYISEDDKPHRIKRTQISTTAHS